MPVPAKIRKTQEFYRDELTDMEFYTRLSKKVKDSQLRKSLERLSSVELEHSEFWKKYLAKFGVDASVLKPRRFRVAYMLFLHMVLGIGLTAKIMEHGEVETVAAYRDAETLDREDEEFRSGLEKIIDDEVEHEDVFSYTLEQNSERLEQNRNIIYGISDGLVEVLASLAGLTALITDHLYVALGGLIVGVSGALSMSVGAYLARNSEMQYRISQKRRSAILNGDGSTEVDVGKYAGKARRSAMDTGLFYILGAAIPIIPFAFLPVVPSLIVSVVLVALTQAISYSIVAISMNMPIGTEALKAAGLALLAAFGSYLVGQIFHIIFHISFL